jgi:hypothetical protein
MYVDEVGHASLKSCHGEGDRYLSLSGVIMELEYVRDVAAPALEQLKAAFFGSHPDEPVILHRKELVGKKPPFAALRDPETRERFDKSLLGLLTDLEYQLVTVTIDKQEQLTRYRVWQFDPYHYATQVLLERFVMWLERCGACGDVLAESRGGPEDMRLKRSFARVWEEGTQFMEACRFQSALTSRQLKVKPKANNIAGLQIADLVAHPCFRMMLCEREGEAMTAAFGRQVVELARGAKYLRSPSGKIGGWGTKWLP